MDDFEKTAKQHRDNLKESLKELKGLLVLYGTHGARTWPDTAEPHDLHKFAEACNEVARWKLEVSRDEGMAKQRELRKRYERRRS